MTTTNAFDVKFNMRTLRVVPFELAELPSQAHRYEAFCMFYNCLLYKFDVDLLYFNSLKEYFGEKVMMAYNNWQDDYRGLPTYEQYRELVELFNEAIAGGHVMRQQATEAQASLGAQASEPAPEPILKAAPAPAPEPQPAPQPVHQTQGIFDGVVYRDRKAERIAAEKEEARQKAERERIHNECLQTVMQWMQELPAGFKRAGKEPVRLSKLHPDSKMPGRAFMWSSGWHITGGVYVTTDGSFYFVDKRSPTGLGSVVIIKRLSAKQAIEIAFDTRSYPIFQQDDGTIMTAIRYDRDGYPYPGSRDIKQRLIDLVTQ